VITRRQTQVIELIAKGHTNKQIAELMNVAPSTIKTHREAVLVSLEANNAPHAVYIAMSRGIIRSDLDYFGVGF